jgi:hypothetical protein
MHQRLQQSVHGRPTQGDAFEQLRGAQFVLVDRERFQNVQSPFNGPDAIAAAGAHAKTLQNLACAVCIGMSAWWTTLSFSGKPRSWA